ncbi:hypothetical protein Mapa_012866 [Marchantia paleacea]|nr:hypothetical protein Mapa_012866 [Marchantia paleacea]
MCAKFTLYIDAACRKWTRVLSQVRYFMVGVAEIELRHRFHVSGFLLWHESCQKLFADRSSDSETFTTCCGRAQ